MGSSHKYGTTIELTARAELVNYYTTRSCLNFPFYSFKIYNLFLSLTLSFSVHSSSAASFSLLCSFYPFTFYLLPTTTSSHAPFPYVYLCIYLLLSPSLFLEIPLAFCLSLFAFNKTLVPCKNWEILQLYFILKSRSCSLKHQNPDFAFGGLPFNRFTAGSCFLS